MQHEKASSFILKPSRRSSSRPATRQSVTMSDFEAQLGAFLEMMVTAAVTEMSKVIGSDSAEESGSTRGSPADTVRSPAVSVCRRRCVGVGHLLLSGVDAPSSEQSADHRNRRASSG